MAHAYVAPQAANDRTPRLRARRIPVDVKTLGPVTATMSHRDVGTLQGEVKDLSVHGIAVAVMPLASPTIFVGDRLIDLEVTCGDGTLFRGSGTLRRINEAPDGTLLGIELEGGGIDLAEFHRRGARNSFVQRVQSLDLKSRADRISSEFKAWVADLNGYLSVVRDFLSQEERALEHEDRVTRDGTIAQYLEEFTPSFVAHMVEARDELARLVSTVPESDQALHRDYFRLHVLPLLMESPLLRRSYTKPLGYAGDFEMMNMLYRDAVEGSSLFAKAMNIYAASEAAGQATRNRVDYFGDRIRAEVAKSSRDRIRIASIGCGPAREIATLLERTPEVGHRLEIALLDQDERSITYCEKTLTPLAQSTGARIQFVRESVRRLLATRTLGAALGQREFVYSAGLFDYLSDRSFSQLMASLYSALDEGGTMAIGNFSINHPSRWMMEYYCDWFLILRSREQLAAFAQELDPAPSSVVIEAEPAGVNLFLVVQR